MIQHHENQPYLLEAEHDGDFWFVRVHELREDRKKQLWRFEYKLNHPRGRESACLKAWNVFKGRHLQGAD